MEYTAGMSRDTSVNHLMQQWVLEGIPFVCLVEKAGVHCLRDPLKEDSLSFVGDCLESRVAELYSKDCAPHQDLKRVLFQVLKASNHRFAHFCRHLDGPSWHDLPALPALPQPSRLLEQA